MELGWVNAGTIIVDNRWFVVGFLATLGAIFGSFLNVVVYRLPRGISLVHPPSQCPACGQAIAWYDNVPVFGWLLVGGRCRNCQAKISPRYPLVEALIATVAGLLAWSGSVALPSGDADNILYEIDLVSFAFKLLLMCTLISAALIEFDGTWPPRRLVWSALAIGVATTTLLPSLLPPSELLARDGIWASLAGMVASLIVGGGPWIIRYLFADHSKSDGPTSELRELILVGGFVGDRTICLIGVISMLLYVLVRLLSRRRQAARYPWAAILSLVTLGWFVCGAVVSVRMAEMPEIVLLGLAAFCTTVLAIGLRAVEDRSVKPTRS